MNYFFPRVAVIAALTVVLSGCNARSYLSKGDAHYKTGKYADAVLDYRKAIQKDGQLGEAYYGLALSDLDQKNSPEAYQALRRAVELLPHRLDVKVKLADILLSAYQQDSHDAGVYARLKETVDRIRAIDPNSFDGLRLAGDLALFDRKPAQAADLLSRANAIRPFQDYVILGYVQALIQLDRGAEAERAARAMLTRRKDFGPLYEVLSNYYLSIGDTVRAEEVLREKIRGNPADSGSFIQLASYFREHNNAAGVQAVIKELTDGYATRSDAFFAAGDFYTHFQEWEQAAAEYQRGVEHQPGQSAAFEKRLASIRIAQKRGAEALRILDAILAKSPSDTEAELLTAGLLGEHSDSADLAKAVTIFRDVLKRQPENQGALIGLAKACYARHDLAEARKALLAARQVNPAAEEPSLLLARIAMEQGNFSEALIDLDELLRISPASPQGRYLRINALMQLGRYDEARPVLDKLARDFPGSSDLGLLRGLVAVLSERYQDAEFIFSRISTPGSDVGASLGLAEAYAGRQQFEKAVQLLDAVARKSPREPAVHRALAKAELRAGNYDRAVQELDGLLSKDPNSATLHVDLGQAFQAKGDFERAAREFDNAARQLPRDSYPALLLGFTLDAAGRTDDAIRAYRRALALRNDDALILNNLAYALAERGAAADLEEALQLSQRAGQISPNEKDLQDTLGWILLKKGMAARSLDLFSRLCRENPGNPSYQHHLALAYLGSGRTGEARKALTAALEAHPSPKEASEIRAEMEKVARL